MAGECAVCLRPVGEEHASWCSTRRDMPLPKKKMVMCYSYSCGVPTSRTVDKKCGMCGMRDEEPTEEKPQPDARP